MTGLLKKIEIVDCFSKANTTEEITTKLIYDILAIYSGSNSVDYIKLMASLLKDIRNICGLNNTMRKSFNMTMTARVQTQHSVRQEDFGRNAVSKSQELGGKIKNFKVELKDVQSEIRTIKAVFNLVKQAVRIL